MSFGAIAGAVFDAAKDIWSSQDSQRFAGHQADDQREWQEQMSNTAYQRKVEDLKKAGLNVGLAYDQGGVGATTPSGGISAGPQPLKSNFSQSYASAKQADLINSQRLVNESQAVKNEQEAINSALLADKIQADTRVSVNSAQHLETLNQLDQHRINEVIARTHNIDSDSKRIEAATQLAWEQVKLMPLTQQEKLAYIRQAVSAAELSHANAGLSREDTRKAKAYADFYSSGEGRHAIEMGGINNPWSAAAYAGRNVPSVGNFLSNLWELPGRAVGSALNSYQKGKASVLNKYPPKGSQ